jgi:hypothetical protein
MHASTQIADITMMLNHIAGFTNVTVLVLFFFWDKGFSSCLNWQFVNTQNLGLHAM